MKDKMLAIGKSLALLCICSILFSLIFSTLYYAHIISQSIFHILNWIFGCTAYFICRYITWNRYYKKSAVTRFGHFNCYRCVWLFLYGCVYNS